MNLKHLISVEKWTCVLAAVVIAAALLVLGLKAAWGVSLGAGLMVLNAYALRRIGARAFSTFKKPGAAVLLFNLKMALLMALVYVVVRYLHVEPVPFIIGISVFPAAIVIVAVTHAINPPDTDNPTDPIEENHG